MCQNQNNKLPSFSSHPPARFVLVVFLKSSLYEVIVALVVRLMLLDVAFVFESEVAVGATEMNETLTGEGFMVICEKKQSKVLA